MNRAASVSRSGVVATHSATAVRLVLSSAVTGTGHVAVAPQNEADPLWECPIGHTLQQKGLLVRRFRTGKVTDVVPACGVGHALVLNLSGNRDRCRNMSGGMLDYACPIGYCGVILAGQDVCRNTAADEYSPIGTRNIAGHRRGRAAPPGTW